MGAAGRGRSGALISLRGVRLGTATCSRYDRAIHACAATGNRERAELWSARAEAAGQRLCCQIFGCLVTLCAADGDEARAEVWFAKALAEGLSPGDRSYQIFEQLCIARGDSAKAELWRCKRQAPDIRLRRPDTSGLIQDCARRGDIREAEDWAIVILDSGEALDEEALKALALANDRAGFPDRASQWLSQNSGLKSPMCNEAREHSSTDRTEGPTEPEWPSTDDGY